MNKQTGKFNSINKNAKIDAFFKYIFLIAAIISSSFILIIVGIILFKGIYPFATDNNGIGSVNLWTFITGTTWLIGDTFSSNVYGVGFIIVSTTYIVVLSLFISVPISVLTGLYIAKIAHRKISQILRTTIELLSSIPSIVYGLFGAGVILPLVYNISAQMGYQSKGGNSIISVVLILSLMTIPTITAISEVAIRSVDQSIIKASLSVGATQTQTNFKVVLQAAKSGIFTAVILGIGRALGEATAVSLVAGGRRDGISFNILDITSTLTTIMLEGFKETTGIDYDIRFSVGIVLMVVILMTNMILNLIKKKIGNVYEK